MFNFKHARILFLLFLSACSCVKVEDYSANRPTLDIRQFLNGDLKAAGAFFSRSGEAEPQFRITLKGEWHGNDGTLKEHFVYNDGRTQNRMWNIHFTDDHHITATAADVIGTATGAQYGNALNLHYVLIIPAKDGGSHEVTVDDWIFLLDNKTAINRAQMSKFGVNAGELVITFSKK